MQDGSDIPADVARLLATLPEPVQPLALLARRLVLDTLSCPVETVAAKAKVIGYGYGGGYKNLVATIILSRKGVKIGLVHGASLPDPGGLLRGDGGVHRHIAIQVQDQLRQAGVKQLLEAGLNAWRQRSSPADATKARSARSAARGLRGGRE